MRLTPDSWTGQQCTAVGTVTTVTSLLISCWAVKFIRIPYVLCIPYVHTRARARARNKLTPYDYSGERLFTAQPQEHVCKYAVLQ